MKKLLLLLIPFLLCAAITYGQVSAISKTGISLQRHQLGATVGTGQAGTQPTFKTVARNGSQSQNVMAPIVPSAWITPWVFAQSSGTYTAISGGTVLGDATNDENVFGVYSIGFNFTYNGTVYTQFSVATNGFIGLGGTAVASSALPISGGTSNNIISALGIDLQGQTGSDLEYLLSGTSPNQTLVVQWTNYRKKSATGDIFNFQIRLNQADNSIVFVYNAFTVNATNGTVQVGVRGASSADYNNRSVTTGTWAASTAGTSNTASCRLRTATKPANGQTYTWTPVTCNNINTFPYNEDFSATLNPCWSAATVSGTYNWTMATTITYPDQGWSLSPESGTYMAAYDSYDATAGYGARLKTATFDFTSLTNPSVDFYMSQDAGYTNPDSINVQVSTNGGTSWTTLYPSFKRYNSSFSLPGWQKYTQYLPAYAGMNNVTLAFLSTSEYGNKMAIDNVTVKQGLTDDVGTAGIFAPTKLPKGQAYKWWSMVKNYTPTTESFTVDTKLQVNGSPTLTTTNTITSLPYNTLTTLSGSYSLAPYAAGSSFDILNKTNLATDQNTLNDQLINSTRACVNDTIYAWDDGTYESSVGFNTGSGWLGQVYYLSVQDTLTSISVDWGTIPGALAGNSLEIYNVSGGVPTTKFADIVTGISLAAANSNVWSTYKPSSPIILPAGTYWIGAHQSVVLTGTYLVSTDETGLTSDSFLHGFGFYSADGSTWTDYATGGLNSINMIRPNFANVLIPFVSNPTAFVATPISSSEIDLGWALNGNGNNVLLAFSTTGTFGTPVSGTVYSAGNSIPGGGTVLQYNNLTSFHHTGLTANTVYYYMAWSYNGTIYSGGVSANGQTQCAETPSPWTEDFEAATFPPSCWGVNSLSPSWARSTAASGYGTGTASALAQFYAIDVSTPFALFTLPFNQGSLLAPTLSFDYAYATYPSAAADEMDVYYSTNDGATFSLLLAMPGGATGILNTGGSSTTEFVPTAAQWGKQTLILPAGTNMIAFNAISGYGNDLYLDNVKIVEGLAHDVGVSALDPRQVYPLGTVTPVATVKNYGGTTETFTVTMTIGSYTSIKTVSGLGAGLTQVVTFDPWTNSLGDYTVSVCTALATDLNTGNDCMTHALKVLNLPNKQVYGYNAYPGTGTDPEGPTSFNLSSPGTLNSLADQSTLNYVTGGTWANGIWYGTVANAASTIPYYFITLDPVTGARTIIGDMGISMEGLSYNTVNNTMYAVGYDGTNSNLYTINIATGAPTLVGSCGARLLINLAINTAGQAYSVDIDADVLGTINLTTAAFTAVGSIGFDASYAQDMEFDRESGELYMAAQDLSSGWLAWVNQSTGNTMKIGDFEGGAEITGFAIPYSFNKTLNVKVFLEGLYNGVGGMNKAQGSSGDQFPGTTADQVTIELHNASTGALVYSLNNVNLSTSGMISGTVPATYNGSYFLYIKHRNSIITSTASPVSFSGSTINYDFSTGIAQAFGSNMKAIGAVAVIFAGDVNQDNGIDSSDMIAVDNDNASFATGYLPTDVDGSGGIDSSDMILVDNNNALFVGSILPF